MTFNFHLVFSFIKHFLTAKRKGHGVHSPFAYRLCEEVFYNSDRFYQFEKLDKIRQQLLNDESELKIEDFGAGSKTFKQNVRKVKDIARTGISSKKQSELFYKLLNYLDCNSCIELGTSIGLNTLYLASVRSSIKITSIEGSEALHNYAMQLAKKNGIYNIQFICGKFDIVLQQVLTSGTTTDFIYIDGNHTYEATLKYFNLALNHVNNNTVLVFDDIYWSKGMTHAWNEITAHNKVKLSMDLFYFGLVFFKEELKNKTHLKLYI